MRALRGAASHSGLAGLRMAIGTLTILPVRVTRVDRDTAGRAMTVAPVVGAIVAAAGALPLVTATALGLAPLLAAGLALGGSAVVTRGLHLDGLADLADGLGSARPAPEALDVMRRSDIGPFGVVTLTVILLVQAAALAQLIRAGLPTAVAGLVTAALAGRSAMTWACVRRIPAARPEGLGAMVAGTVSYPRALTATGLTLLVSSVGVEYGGAVLAGLVVAAGVLWHAVNRLGGTTGDVLGALSEIASTAALVVVAAQV